MVTATRPLFQRAEISADILEECARRFLTGTTLRELARDIDVNHESLRRQLQRAGVDTSRGPRQYCKRGHPWTPENVYTNRQGESSCRLCTRQQKAASRARGVVKQHVDIVPDPVSESKPAPAQGWKGFQLPPAQAHLRGEKAIALIARAFTFRLGHAPTIILSHPANLCCVDDVMVRERQAGEPQGDEITYFAR